MYYNLCQTKSTICGFNTLIEKLFLLGLLILLLGLQWPAYATEKHNQKAKITFAVLPDSSREILQQRYRPLLQYIEQATGLSTELVIPQNHRQMLDLFKQQQVDIGLFCGYSFIKAQQTSKAVPLIMRDIDFKFSSFFIVHPSIKKKKIEDFANRSISFGHKMSTSGHIMPRYFLIERNIIPENFFSKIIYSGGHDKTAYLVRDRKVELGAANSNVIKTMLLQGLLKKSDIRVLWETPSYTDYVWAIQPDFNQHLKQKVLDLFLSLSLMDEQGRKILEPLGTDGFLPANNADFDDLRRIIRLLEPELL